VKAIYLFSTVVLLTWLPRPAAAQNDAVAPLRRVDAGAYFGWFGGNKSDLNAYEHWYKDAWHGSLSAGYYWTEHLKTELDFCGTSRADLYGRPVTFQTPTGTGLSNIHHEFSTRSLTLVQHYQFGRNAWFHPTLGAGVALTWETERRQIPPLYFYDTSSRVPTSRLIEPARTEGPETRLRAGALATAGFKAYVSERAFFRSDGRVSVRDGVDDVTVRFGFGVDF
jgi:outer membrane protein W